MNRNAAAVCLTQQSRIYRQMVNKKSTGPSATKKKGRQKAATKTARAKSPPSSKLASKRGQKKAIPRDKATRDPKGGLTAAGRKYFKKTQGSDLKPGVRGPADTPEKQKRKGSFLRRHFAHPRGPMEADGKPTRLALSARAWGEPLPKNASDAKVLAGKGRKLLDRYRSSKDKQETKTSSRKKKT